MALFGIGKKNTEEKKAVKPAKKTLDLKGKKKPAVKKVAVKDGDVKAAATSSKSSNKPRKVVSSHIIISPRITEKAGMLSERQVYTFNVTKWATKHQIAAAVEELYKVRPAKVSISSVKSKVTFRRGRIGHTAGGKKAYVYLNAGDKIEFV